VKAVKVTFFIPSSINPISFLSGLMESAKINPPYGLFAENGKLVRIEKCDWDKDYEHGYVSVVPIVDGGE
jgi:hypothetical protein